MRGSQNRELNNSGDSKKMEFLIVTGLSGAGKSNVINALEDSGFYCVDNMPPMMILRFYRICKKSNDEDFEKVAVVTDIRGGEPFKTLLTDLEVLKVQGNPFKVLFINCSERVLLNRFKETRRKHPLSNEYEDSMEDAIKAEIEMLKPAYKMADYMIDTTELSPTQLKNRVKDMFGSNDYEQMVVHIMSFGFKYGSNREADLMFDVRCFPNPYYVPELKNHTGLESCVREYVMKDEKTRGFISRLYDMIDYMIPLYKKEGKSELVIGIGCTGGKHRSVTIAENLGAYLISKGNKVVISHRDITKKSS